MHAEPHCADITDHDLLDDLTCAAAWWAQQRAWRVTSSHTGGGVIASLEEAVASRVAPDAYGLALPNATVALAVALEAIGVAPGSEVGVPALDWSAAAGLTSALGIHAVPLPVSPGTGLLDIARLACAPAITRRLAAVVAVHMHGLTCDVPRLRRVSPGLPIVEDAAQAWAACYPGGEPVGSAADACAFSFGAAKSPSAGELGCLVSRTPRLHQIAVALTQHPTRQLLAGITTPRYDRPMARVAPAVALLGAYVINRHAAQVSGLRRAGAVVAARLRDAGLPVMTDPAIHSPGVIAVHAAREKVIAGLCSVVPGPGIVVASVDRAQVRAHTGADGQSRRDLPVIITVITLADHTRPAYVGPSGGHYPRVRPCFTNGC
jgi:DegT/DnrJ/EryC1/StrS aminotransferase family